MVHLHVHMFDVTLACTEMTLSHSYDIKQDQGDRFRCYIIHTASAIASQ